MLTLMLVVKLTGSRGVRNLLGLYQQMSPSVLALVTARHDLSYSACCSTVTTLLRVSRAVREMQAAARG